jgi:hypothetical protein
MLHFKDDKSKRSSGRKTRRAKLFSIILRRLLEHLLQKVEADGPPNMNPLWMNLRDSELARLNVKNMGYDIARALGTSRMSPAPAEPTADLLGWRASTQRDIESAWCAYWCGQLGIRPIYHRKIWELCYILQSMHTCGVLQPGKQGLGFGCGREPIPSLLASRGVQVLATDLPPEHDGTMGWRSTSQHTTELEALWHAHLVTREAFESQVRLQHVDMNNIPSTLTDFDFCWSTCALEHLGSIEKGLQFIENSLETLRPGGVSIHTTEFNISEADTIDNWPTVLFQRQNFERLAERLRRLNCLVEPISFETGDGVLDRFVDLPPYSGLPAGMSTIGDHPAHLKLSVDGFPATCFGMTILKR